MSLPSYLPEAQRSLDGVPEYKGEQDEQQMLELLNYYRQKLGKCHRAGQSARYSFIYFLIQTTTKKSGSNGFAKRSRCSLRFRRTRIKRRRSSKGRRRSLNCRRR